MSKRILIADDDLAILESLKLLLEMFHYEVETTADGRVVEKIREVRPQLLLLDIWMSGVDGREICREIKRDKEMSKIPVIMVSASRDVSRSSKESGAEEFLPKPFEMDELLQKVGKYLD